MATPVNPIEVWASEDYVLPNTHELNKERPIDDLWKKGYDMGQKPSVEHWNYLFHLVTDWIRYLDQDALPGLDGRYYQIANNLSEIPDRVAARNNLEVYSRAESDGRFVNVTGDVMTGGLTVPVVNTNGINFTPADSDVAWIKTTVPSADTTYLDIGVGDNFGDPDAPGSDKIRFRFIPVAESGSPEFTLAEFSATDASTALFRVFGAIHSVRMDIDTDIVWNGNGYGNTLRINQFVDADSLNIRSTSAVVAGKNIVRSVNGQQADANGDVNVESGVQDIRWSALQSQSGPDFVSGPPLGGGRRSRTSTLPAGAVMVNVADASTQEIWIEDVDVIYYRFLQKQIGGIWVTVAAL